MLLACAVVQQVLPDVSATSRQQPFIIGVQSSATPAIHASQQTWQIWLDDAAAQGRAQVIDGNHGRAAYTTLLDRPGITSQQAQQLRYGRPVRFELSVCLSVCLSVFLLVYVSVCVSVCLSVVRLSVCLSGRLAGWLVGRMHAALLAIDGTCSVVLASPQAVLYVFNDPYGPGEQDALLALGGCTNASSVGATKAITFAETLMLIRKRLEQVRQPRHACPLFNLSAPPLCAHSAARLT
jgi:hypothetical protein